MHRRSFIKKTLAGTTTITIFPGITNLSSCNTISNNSSLFDHFLHPQPEAKPFYRWWWNGNKVTKEELLRELTIIRDSGAGGVEINPIELLFDEGFEHIPGLTWLSDEWLNALKFACVKAKELGLIVDLIVGTGWPFGGEFLNDNETIQGVTPERIEITGKGKHSIKIDQPAKGERIQQVALVPNPLGSFNEITEITDLLTSDGTIEFTNTSASNYLHILRWKSKFRDVMHGSPGGAGPVLDHFNKDAVKKYLNRISDRLNHVFEGKTGDYIRCMFCDSIELSGANWFDDILQVFETRYGYRLEPYLPLLIDDHRSLEFIDDEPEDILQRVRYDYSSMMADAFTDRFILPFHEWCHEMGVKSRLQVYGFPWFITDQVDSGMIADIPEGDIWLYNGAWQSNRVNIDDIRYAILNKYASSSGKLAGRRIISSEAMTNTRGVWEATLGYIKQATDASFMAGINHLVLHGYNYSPPEAGFPGWLIFGTYFSDQNSWWPYISLWSGYTARISSLLQHTRQATQIALLGPTTDIWSKKGLDREDFLGDPWYKHEIWQAFSHNGYLMDYISEKIIRESTWENGKINFNGAAFDILFLANVETILPETAASLYDFAANGGKIVFINSIPLKSPGLQNRKANDEQVKHFMDKIVEEFHDHIFRLELKEKNNLPGQIGTFMKKTGIKPLVEIENPDNRFFFLKSADPLHEVYLLFNLDKQRKISVNCRFNTTCKSMNVWDPEKGEMELMEENYLGKPKQIALNPLESKIIVFNANKRDMVFEPLAVSSQPVLHLSGWKLKANHINGQVMEFELDHPTDLTNIPELRSFAGTIEYQTSFFVEEPENLVLDPGRSRDVMEVWVNDEKVGMMWYGHRLFDLCGKLRKGENTLKLVLTTTLINYVRTIENNPFVDHFTDRSPEGRKVRSFGILGVVAMYRKVAEQG